MQTLKTEAEYVQEMRDAKASGDPHRIMESVIEFLRPEARLAIEMAQKDITHKDGYSVIMRIASNFGIYVDAFYDALAREGYPKDTIQTIKNLSN